ncbi:jg3126, partial [Pararge aegeria aegeria]
SDHPRPEAGYALHSPHLFSRMPYEVTLKVRRSVFCLQRLLVLVAQKTIYCVHEPVSPAWILRTWETVVDFCEEMISQKEAAERMSEEAVNAHPLRRRLGGRRTCLPWEDDG